MDSLLGSSLLAFRQLPSGGREGEREGKREREEGREKEREEEGEMGRRGWERERKLSGLFC